MFVLDRLRSHQLHHDISWQLEDIMDPRMCSSLHHSTMASAPSLRASEPFLPFVAPPASDAPGNVKVVVRCRAFLKRGEMDLIPNGTR